MNRIALPIFLELTPLTRQRLENAIETLVILLDDFEGDPDFEPDVDDEPNGDDEPDADDEPDYDDEDEMHWTPEIGSQYHIQPRD